MSMNPQAGERSHEQHQLPSQDEQESRDLDSFVEEVEAKVIENPEILERMLDKPEIMARVVQHGFKGPVPPPEMLLQYNRSRPRTCQQTG